MQFLDFLVSLITSQSEPEDVTNLTDKPDLHHPESSTPLDQMCDQRPDRSVLL